MKVLRRCHSCDGEAVVGFPPEPCAWCKGLGARVWTENLPRREALKIAVWTAVAQEVARLGTCPRRSVGCVLVDKRGHVLSTGHNGAAAGQPHCIDARCPGADLPSGTGLDQCEAIHAEANALLQCERVWDIHTVYCTDSPCLACVKLLLNTSASRICFVREYPAPASRSLWLRSRPDREWVQTGDDLR